MSIAETNEGTFRSRLSRMGIKIDETFDTEELAEDHETATLFAMLALKKLGIKKIEPLESLHFDEVRELPLTKAIRELLSPASEKTNPTLNQLALADFERKHKGQLKKSGPIPNYGRITFWMNDDYSAEKRIYKRPRSEATGETRMIPKIVNKRLKDITPDDLITLRQDLIDMGESASTVNRLFSVCQGMVTRTIKRHLIPILNPFGSVMTAGDGTNHDEFAKLEEVGEKTKAYTDDEVTAIINWLYAFGKKTLIDWPFGSGKFLFWGPLVEFMAETGIRKRYCLHLNMDDIVDDADGNLYVEKDMKGRRNTHRRTIPLNAAATAVLKSQWKIAEDNEGWFFPHTPNQPYGTLDENVSVSIDYKPIHAAMAASLDEVLESHAPFHSFRAYQATRLHYALGDDDIGAEILGVGVKVFRGYVNTSMAHLQKQIAKMAKVGTKRAVNRPALKIVI